MRLFLLAALVAPALAQAEVKPRGTVLDNLCGKPARSVTVCLATRVGYPGDYLTLTTPQGRRLLKVRSVSREAGATTYSAWAPGPGAATVMVNYELQVRHTSRKAVGTFKVDGRTSGKARFDMEVIFHTQSLGF